MKKLKTIFSITALIAFALLAISCGRKKNIKTDSKTEVVSKTANENLPDISGYAIVGTNQKTFYNNTEKTTIQKEDEDFYGQNANYIGNEPNYVDNGDGIVTDKPLC